MHVVTIEHPVPDFDRWKHAFDSDPADRKGSGVRRYRILRLREDPNHVLIDLEFDTIEKAEAFLRTMERIWRGPGRAVMQNPRARVADLVEAREV
jgi:hypothetical protein